jgi:hypothetical protein
MHCATRRIVVALFLPAVTCAVVRWSICEVALRGPADVERQMDLAARLQLWSGWSGSWAVSNRAMLR